MDRAPTILLIDDCPRIHAVVEVWLARDGARVVDAFDGPGGVAMAIAEQPAVVLLDLVLERERGSDVLDCLMDTPATRDIPVIVLSGAGDTVTKVRCLDAGAIDYITKPFEPMDLRARVRVGLRLRRCQELLARQARIDALTGCWNRGYFDERLATEVATALRHQRPLGLILVDVDHFKQINDSRGHVSGDRGLQLVAEVLRQTVNPSDSVCRFGGDEFAILVREAPRDRLERLAERVVEAVRQRAPRVLFPITVSVGGALLSQVPRDHGPSGLFGCADAALYEAKRRGRGQGVVAASTPQHP